MSTVPTPGTFPAAFERELSYVCHSLRRLGIPPANVEDLAQDVFLKAFQAFDAYDPTRPLRPWLFGIAFRVASNFRKHSSFRTEGIHDLPELVDDRRTPEENAEQAHARRLMLRLLDTLDDDRRAVFVLHEIDGLGIPEVAHALGIPVNTAYTRLRAARLKFAEEVRRISERGAA